MTHFFTFTYVYLHLFLLVIKLRLIGCVHSSGFENGIDSQRQTKTISGLDSENSCFSPGNYELRA